MGVKKVKKAEEKVVSKSKEVVIPPMYELGDALYAKQDCMNNFKKGEKVEITDQTSATTFMVNDVVELDQEVIKENFSREVIPPEISGTNIASTEVMEKTLELVADRFNLRGDYVMTSFSDGGMRSEVTMSNQDFEVKVKVKNLEVHGIKYRD